MTDAIDLLWAAFDTPEPVFSAETRNSFAAHVFDDLIDIGLLVRGENASHVTCPNCDDRHVEEVETRPGPNGATRFFIPCPESLRMEIAADALLQWRPDFAVLARLVRGCMGIEGRVRERVQGQLWRVGEVGWQDQPREIFMARGLSWPSGSLVSTQCAGPSRPIVLIGLTPPPERCWPGAVPAVVPLPAIVNLEGGRLDLNLALLHRMVADADAAAAQSAAVADSELRKTIDRLVEQRLAEGPVNELLRAFEAQGLSSRAIEEELRKRGVIMDHATISRRLAKSRQAGSVVSSRSILREASSQPRDKHGAPIYEAEPSED